ncbi:Putative nuclease HARBI1 [Linum perenne]
MARRPTLRERQKVIASVIAMWFQLMQQYMVLLSKLAVAQTLLAANHRADPTFIVLPLPRIVYRVGFMHYATKTTDQMCVNMLRMRRHIFEKLCNLLQDEGGLRRSKHMDIEEMVAIFLVTVGHNIKNRKAQFLFQRSAETISRVIKLVLLSILMLESQLLATPTPVPHDCTHKNWKYFQGRMGALDGMHVSVRARIAQAPKYRNRKGQTTINVLGVCNQNLQFVYCLSGWPGSAHDSRVLKDALARSDCFSVPAGTYYLCDAGYTNARGFLAPYRSQRYHLTEWGRHRPATKEENYNMRHSRARNVIECSFGIMKMRWALLRDTSCLLVMSRAYRAWSQQEEQVLFDILHSLHDAGSIQAGTLKDCGYTDIEKRLKVLVPNTKHTADSIKGKFRQFKGKFQAQSHKLAAGLNNTKLPRWEDLCKILEVNRADGRESMTARDAASRLDGINAQMEIFQETIARTTANIERLTNNWCLPEDVASRRALLVEEIERLPGISYRQGLLAIRIMMKDHADMETFCMLPSDEMKADFILTILE